MANGPALLKDKDKPKKQRKKTQSQLKKILDKLFSEYIRRKYANEKGEVECYTCGVKKHYKEMQCGHFVSRQHLATRYDEDNCRVQDRGCNIFGRGMVAEFARRLEGELGDGTVARLYKKAATITPNFPYEAKIEEYKKKLSELNN